MTPLHVIGSGGHAKVVIDAALASGCFEVVGVLDDAESRWGASVLGVPVVGPATRAMVVRLGIRRAVVAVGANRLRASLVERLDGLVTWTTVIHPSAYLARETSLGAGTVVAAGAIVQPGAIVGRHVILNTSCSVDHDGQVDDFAHLCPGARLAGGVRIDRGALLCVGACVIPGRRVGAWSTIGAGGVVVDDIPARRVAVGVPARCRVEAPSEHVSTP